MNDIILPNCQLTFFGITVIFHNWKVNTYFVSVSSGGRFFRGTRENIFHTFCAIVGDGICNDETNNVECSFDGGDCCNSDANMDSCTSCVCFLEETCLAGVHPLVGNEFCNDETNIKECDYDDFECCGFHSSSYNVNQDFCTDCLCKGVYLIIQGICINEALNQLHHRYREET